MVLAGSRIAVVPSATSQATADATSDLRVRRGGLRLGSALEGLAVLAAPVVMYFVLRLRAMTPMAIPDPSIHSSYIFDPRDLFLRYSAALNPTARLREGARVGFLVPARLAYLAFGAVPGFFVFRFVLVILAVAPTYVLLRRLYGVGAGALAVAVIMASPVLVTAWGTDFPDSSVVSYLIAGLACLVMPVARRRTQMVMLAAAASLFTLAVWALATSAVLVATTLLIYLLVRCRRARADLVTDVSVLAFVAVVVTLALGVGSWLELGQFDYIKPTVDSLRYLDTPAQAVLWHSTNWRWVRYDVYLLLLPAAAVAWFVAFGRRPQPIGRAQLTIGLVLGAECVASFYIQFFNHVQVLEEPYFSATLWSALTLATIVTLAELTRPLAAHRALQFAPALLVVAVALGYEVHPHVPAFDWSPTGFVVAALVIGAAVVGRRLGHDPRQMVAGLVGAGVVVVTSGAALVLTVAPTPAHAPLSGTIFDPPTMYASALGGSAAPLIDYYRLTSDVPGFIGPAAYRGEQLLTCWSAANAGATAEHGENLSVVGLFHGSYNLLPGYCPDISAQGIEDIDQRHAAQLLVISESPMNLPLLLSRLAPLQPKIVRETVLHSGRYHLDLWLVDLLRDMPPRPA
jgi:hypothetical protein